MGMVYFEVKRWVHLVGVEGLIGSVKHEIIESKLMWKG